MSNTNRLSDSETLSSSWTESFCFWTTCSCLLCHRPCKPSQFYQVQSIWVSCASSHILMCDIFYKIKHRKICRHPQWLTNIFSAVYRKACMVFSRANQGAMFTNLPSGQLPIGQLGSSFCHHVQWTVVKWTICPWIAYTLYICYILEVWGDLHWRLQAATSSLLLALCLWHFLARVTQHSDDIDYPNTIRQTQIPNTLLKIQLTLDGWASEPARPRNKLVLGVGSIESAHIFGIRQLLRWEILEVSMKSHVF